MARQTLYSKAMKIKDNNPSLVEGGWGRMRRRKKRMINSVNPYKKSRVYLVMSSMNLRLKFKVRFLKMHQYQTKYSGLYL